MRPGQGAGLGGLFSTLSVIVGSCLLLPWLCCGVTDIMQSEVRTQLTDVKGARPVSGGLAALSVYVVLDTVQDALPGGIEFTLEYLNEGSQDIELFNPIDHVQYTLVDAAGYPVPSPPYAPRLLIQSADDPRVQLENKFLIVAIRENGHRKDIAEALRKERMVLSAGGRYEITLGIQKIPDPASPGTVIPLPAAPYKIVLTCSLVTPAESMGDENPFRVLESSQIPVEVK